VRKESAGDDASHVEEREHALQEGACQAEEDAVELARQNTAADKVVADAAAAAKAKQARADEAATEKAAAKEAH
jgi:hypothetical protein